MTKYYGITTLIIGLITAWFLENKIASNKMIISDFINSEIYIGKSSLNNYREIKRFRINDSTSNLLIKLYDSIRLNKPYSLEERKKILRHLKQENDFLPNTSNIVLFNTLCDKLISQHNQTISQSKNTLIIDKIKQFENDSIDITLAQVIFPNKNLEMEYYYKGKTLLKNQLKNFTDNLEYFEAKITNPLTGEVNIIKRR